MGNYCVGSISTIFQVFQYVDWIEANRGWLFKNRIILLPSLWLFLYFYSFLTTTKIPQLERTLPSYSAFFLLFVFVAKCHAPRPALSRTSSLENKIKKIKFLFFNIWQTNAPPLVPSGGKRPRSRSQNGDPLTPRLGLEQEQILPIRMISALRRRPTPGPRRTNLRPPHI